MFTFSFSKAITACVLLVISTTSFAAGLLKPKQSGLPDLHMKTHHVNAVIENGYVTTYVEQVFYNPNDQVLEAIYSFPIPENAVVGEFSYWIDGKKVVGEVVKKAQARQIYEDQKSQGKQTALVEQDSHKTFDIAVYPVQPKSQVKIELVYLQHAHVDHDIGRYVYPLEDGGVDEEQLSFWERNEVVTEAFSFNLIFRSSYPIDAIRLPKHPQATISQLSDTQWQAHFINQAFQQASQTETVKETEHGAEATQANIIKLNQDIVLYWRYAQDTPAALDLVTFKEPGSAKGTFMFSLFPGDDVKPISQGTDWVFVLDISGSMQGKFATLVEGIRQALGKLRMQDRYKIVLFNNQSHELTRGFQDINPSNIEATLNQLSTLKAEGGTNLYSGITRGLKGLNSDRPTGLILVTDGVANVGVTEKKTFLSLLQQYDVRLFTFVMGNSANRPLLTEMSDISNGFSMAVSNSDDIVGRLLQASSKLTHNAFRDIILSIDGVRTSDLTPDTIHTLYRGEQLVVFGHYWNDGDAKVTLNATLGAEEKTYQTQIHFPAEDTRNPELERLWAFAKINDLKKQIDYLGEDQDAKDAITDIALEYSLVTNLTSMIVVEETVFEELHIERKNQQRVAKENAAREVRKNQPVQDNRADKQQPMFNAPRPSSGGGGALDQLLLGLILLTLTAKLYAHRRQRITSHIKTL